MAIQYSGNAQTSTFTPSTKQNIIDSVETALLAASWTTVSGHGTTNLLMQSATTPQGYDMRIRLKDNSGTCVTFSMESSDAVLTGSNSTTAGGGFLNPAAGTYRVVCNKYQAFIYVTPPTTPARGFVAFGVPYVPSWITSVTSRVGWMAGNTISDSSTSVIPTFRTQFTNIATSSTNATNQAMYNATLWTLNNTVSGGIGEISLASMVSPANASGSTGYRWESNVALFVDALIAWGASAASAEGKFKGQLWDAVVSGDAYAGDTTSTFDGHNWICITDNNTAANIRGTLLIATS